MQVNIQFREETYVDEAEKVIKELGRFNFKHGRDELTTSQIRNLLSLVSTIFNELSFKEVTQLTGKLSYLRVQFVYQSGRNAAVKDLVRTGKILELLEKVQTSKDKRMLIRFCHYFEALVAYFKYYGGQDK
ncbi:CRISPR-system related protein [Ligilactobacillus acidipiscis DSM 15836]|uniref:CRISPR system Cms protein Csm2 n=2 Tax=Ligilactobacillus acidipiscis TaxID=89059 RepID=A0A0R2JYI2_9LACO|nr:CRISPR-system related protein [Ligilactobacillus acidipiscis DSM 15836]KRN82322.1 CRISPR-system related protein [Ligilactobacillus acidipiscis]